MFDSNGVCEKRKLHRISKQNLRVAKDVKTRFEAWELCLGIDRHISIDRNLKLTDM